MIELPLAALLVDRFGDGAEDVIERLGKEKTWVAQELRDLIGDPRVSLIENRSLVLVCAVQLGPSVKWLYGQVDIRDTDIPEVIRMSVAGKPMERLVGHPLIMPQIVTAGLESRSSKDQNGNIASTWITAKAKQHTTTIRHALRLVREHRARNPKTGSK